MNASYAWEKFYLAVENMASSQDSLQQRLGDAYRFHLIHINPDTLPDNIQQDFHKLRERLTRDKAIADEGKVQATIQNMSTDEAAELIKQVVDMFQRVSDEVR